MSAPRKQIINPFTGESMTANEWAKKLGYSSGKTFFTRYYKYGENNKRTWMTLEEAKQHNTELLVKLFDPIAKISGTKTEHANRLGITRCAFSRRLKEFGVKDRRTWKAGQLKKGPKTGQRRDGVGNDEWNSLDDTEKSMKSIDHIRVGTFERDL